MSLDGKYLKKDDVIIGCDEAGRGPLAGPVVGCAVKLDEENKNLLRHLKKLGICDSKKLSPAKRSEILKTLGIELKSLQLGTRYKTSYKGWEFEFVAQECSAQEIDEVNILQASLACMKRASQLLANERPCRVLVDGNRGFEFPHPVEPIVKGDQKLLCISLASIIAKEFRDEKMRLLDELYPGYGLRNHAGYPTAEHRAAIARLGVSPAHRKSFKGVKEYVQESPIEGSGQREENLILI